MEETLTYYLQDLVRLLRDEAQSIREAQPKDAFQRGRLMAYVEVLSLMQAQAGSFNLSRDALGLAGFDPIQELRE